jgi:hypothetical protein
VGGDVAGVAHGKGVVVGRVPQLVHHLKGQGLLALEAVGFTEFTRATGKRSVSSRVRRKASSKFPSTWTILAPCMRLWATLPRATYPAGRITMAVMPARAA